MLKSEIIRYRNDSVQDCGGSSATALLSNATALQLLQSCSYALLCYSCIHFIE